MVIKQVPKISWCRFNTRSDSEGPSTQQLDYVRGCSPGDPYYRLFVERAKAVDLYFGVSSRLMAAKL